MSGPDRTRALEDALGEIAWDAREIAGMMQRDVDALRADHDAPQPSTDNLYAAALAVEAIADKAKQAGAA